MTRLAATWRTQDDKPPAKGTTALIAMQSPDSDLYLLPHMHMWRRGKWLDEETGAALHAVRYWWMDEEDLLGKISETKAVIMIDKKD